jgi:hypothetical protein
MKDKEKVEWKRIITQSEGIVDELRDTPIYLDGCEPYQRLILNGVITKLMLNNTDCKTTKGYKKTHMLCVNNMSALKSHDEFSKSSLEHARQYAKLLGFNDVDIEYAGSHGFDRMFFKANFK